MESNRHLAKPIGYDMDIIGYKWLFIVIDRLRVGNPKKRILQINLLNNWEYKINSGSGNDIINDYHLIASSKKITIQSVKAKGIFIQNPLQKYFKEISSHVTNCATNHG
jgi:hypothetical protein